ncbi:MAG: protein kinase domain-containing protein [Isosphaeraceae bacterium]
MEPESEAWQDSARQILDEWNLESGDEPAACSLTALPKPASSPIQSPNSSPISPQVPDKEGETPLTAPRPLDPYDSFPAGPTMLIHAFVPAGPGPAGTERETPAPGDDISKLSLSLANCSTYRKEKRRPTAADTSQRISLPRAGEELNGFRLLLELGRGAFARVFLAEELSLGSRLVAIKVSRAEGDEPRMLARLQHAHIVPVHSVHDDPATGLRFLCMPFFGGANLAQVLQEAWGLAHAQASGKSLVEALEQLSLRLPSVVGPERVPGSGRLARSRPGSAPQPVDSMPTPPIEQDEAVPPVPAKSGRRRVGRLRDLARRLVGPRQSASPEYDDRDHGLPARRFLRGANGIQASVWIVARLAEGLDHAHARGLLHRDLKPANVLIAADGTPMLLDFNLAAEVEPCAPNEKRVLRRAALGGTLPYMAPEHLEALDPDGWSEPNAVDERSDIYALGLILFEMIGGTSPFPEPPAGLTPVATIRAMIDDRRRRPVPSLRATCPEVPWSLSALVAQCLDPEPGRRYRSASHLAEDLRRFLDDLPMKYCKEPSTRERVEKWARRHPGLCGSTSITLFAVLLMGIMAGSIALVYDRMLDLSARLKLQAFDRAFIESEFLLIVAGRDDELLARGTRQARELLSGLGILDPTAPGRGTGGRATDPLPGVTSLWLNRLRSEELQRLRRQIVELLVLEARGEKKLAERRGTTEDLRRALRRAIARLDQAERLGANVPSALYADRARYHAAIGDAQGAARDRDRAARHANSSSQDLTLLGTSLIDDGDAAAAESVLRTAIARDVTSLWAWFAMGNCHSAQGRYLEAAGDFSACVARGPDYAWNHFYRALALARAGRLLDAKLAYDRALELDRHLHEARVNRALVELELDQPERALADLRAAVAAGRHELGTLAALAEALARLGRLSEAESTFGDLLARNPDDAIVLVARGRTRLKSDPEAARRDFEAVLKHDPRSAAAHYGLARLMRAHDRRAAITHLDLALQSDPSLIDALQLRALERARLGEPAALDDVELLVKAPTAHRFYNAACALALYADAKADPRPLDRAIGLLDLAFKEGFSARQAATDPDLTALRARPQFPALLQQYGPATVAATTATPAPQPR